MSAGRGHTPHSFPVGPLPDIAVVVLVGDNEGELAATVSSLARQSIPPIDIAVAGLNLDAADLPTLIGKASQVPLSHVADTLDADIILVVSAGDILLPHAVETLRSLWTGNATLVVRLELRDELGRIVARRPAGTGVDVDLAFLAANTPEWLRGIDRPCFGCSRSALRDAGPAPTAEALLLAVARAAPVRFINPALVQRSATGRANRAWAVTDGASGTRPRWPLAVAARKAPTGATGSALAATVGTGWCYDETAGLFRLRSGSASLHLCITEADGPVVVSVRLGRLTRPPTESVRVEVRCSNSGSSTTAEIPPGGSKVDLRAIDPGATGEVDIELAVEPSDAAISLDSLSWQADVRPAAMLLDPDKRVAAADLVPISAGGWTVEGGMATLTRPEGTLQFSVPPDGPFDFFLEPAGPAHGTLRLRFEQGGLVFEGRLLGARLVLPLPNTSTEGPLTLAVRFDPHPAFPNDRAAFAAVSITRRHLLRPFYENSTVACPVLNPDHEITLDTAPELAALYLSRVAENDAGLQFRTPADRKNWRLTLSLAGKSSGTPLLVRCGGKRLAEVIVEGNGTVRFAIPDELREPDGAFRVVIAGATPALSPDAGEQRVVLTGFLLEGDTHWNLIASRRAPRPRARPPLIQLLEHVPMADLPRHPGSPFVPVPASLDVGAAFKAVVEEINTLDEDALDALVRSPALLAKIDRLGAEARLAGAGGTLPLQPAPGDAGLRAALIDILSRPAYRSTRFSTLNVHPALMSDPDTLVRYLTREPSGLIALEEAAEIVGHAEKIFSDAATIIAAAPSNSRVFQLANLWIMRWQSKRAVFSGCDLLRLMQTKARAIEWRLDRLGAVRHRSFEPRANVSRLRIGALLRHTAPGPESWGALGMYAALPRERYETVLVSLSKDMPSSEFNKVFDLIIHVDGSETSEAVRSIQALDLDCLILGAYAPSYDEVSEIIAHRLAPLQVLPTIMSPTTLGFASFDAAFLTSATENAGSAESDYAEKAIDVEGPIQGCYLGHRFRPQPTLDCSTARATLGLGNAAVVFSSGAVANKIHRETLAAWVRILHASPESILVLYPFAANWWIQHDAERIRADIAEVVQSGGIDRHRIRVLGECNEDAVLTVLAATDLYLDSFPYSGAVTVCEAAAAGVPTVVLAGRYHRHRTGAGWMRAYGLPDLVADSVDDYVRIAVGLAKDVDRRADVRARLAAVLEATPPHLDVVSYAAALDTALATVAARSGRFPHLFASDTPTPVVKDLTMSNEFDPVDLASKSAEHSRLGDGGSMRRMKKVVILAAERSGSTLLCNIIAGAPAAVCHHELFHATQIQFRANTQYDPELIRRRDMDPIGFLERIISEADSEGHSLFGFKIFANHGNQILDYLMQDTEIKLILLMRSNVLAQYSSSKIARDTGIWAAPRETESSQHVKISFDQADFIRYLERIQMEYMSILSRLSAACRQALILDYTSISTGKALHELADWIEHPLPGTLAEPLLRQSNPDILERFHNPGDIISVLASIDRLDWLSELT